jgi:hypothetical protein
MEKLLEEHILCGRTGSHFTTGQEHIRDKIRSFRIRKGTEWGNLTGIYLAPRKKQLWEQERNIFCVRAGNILTSGQEHVWYMFDTMYSIWLKDTNILETSTGHIWQENRDIKFPKRTGTYLTPGQEPKYIFENSIRAYYKATRIRTVQQYVKIRTGINIQHTRTGINILV